VILLISTVSRISSRPLPSADPRFAASIVYETSRSALVHRPFASCLDSGLYPAIRAARMNPIDALASRVEWFTRGFRNRLRYGGARPVVRCGRRAERQSLLHTTTGPTAI